MRDQSVVDKSERLQFGIQENISFIDMASAAQKNITPPTPASVSESEPRSGGVLGLVRRIRHRIVTHETEKPLFCLIR